MPPSELLHLGCGLCQPDGWINVDGSWNAWLAAHPRLKQLARRLPFVPQNQLDISWRSDILIHDLRRPLPFADASMQVVYSSHTIEHLYRTQALQLLRECYRVLKPGGVTRHVVPDLLARARYYVSHFDQDRPDGTAQADGFINDLLITQEAPVRRNSIYRLYRTFTSFGPHKWMYDGHSLSALLREAGFVSVEIKGLHDSRIERIQDVELPLRVENSVGVCVEGVKPLD